MYSNKYNEKERFKGKVVSYWNESGTPEYCLKDLINDYKKKNRINYIFFWGHQPSKSGELTKTCFSQWWKCTFIEDNNEYNCAEQYMMAKKALLFGDEEIYNKIMRSSNPKEIKALGRKIRNFDEAVWDKEKYSIVLNGNYAKFSQNEDLKAFLIGTKGRVIAEASPYDNIWGIKMSKDDPGIEDPTLWKGENLLGFVLMEVRNKLIRECGSCNV